MPHKSGYGNTNSKKTMGKKSYSNSYGGGSSNGSNGSANYYRPMDSYPKMHSDEY